MTKSILSIISILYFTVSNAAAQNFNNGFNFYLPPDDTTSRQFLPSFPSDSLGSDDFVSIDAGGHFAVNGQRIRFFGTNSTIEGAFPTKSKAWFIAGRLRKMGFNLIRFHHIDNGFSQQSLFEWGQDTRHFNSETLDRLENYIGALKNNGIYINMNLHVSRTFNEQDGVQDADSILNFGKGVTYFDPYLIELQKEYAQQLLTHVNPYTGLALKDDPVMAMVEIINENSLYRMWRSGSIRSLSQGGDFPVRHVRMLDTLWYEYLADTYANTEALRTAWNEGMREEGAGNQIVDSGFENDPINNNWQLEQHETATATMGIDESNPFAGTRSARVDVTNVSGTDWHIQWKQVNITIKEDSIYTVTFAGRSDASRTISIAVQQDTDPWAVFYNASFQLQTEWQTFTFSFRAPQTNDNQTRLSFSLGGEEGSYWFDDIHMGYSSIKGLDDDELLENKTVRRIPFAECVNYSDGRVKDMSAFYLKIQEDFFREMYQYLTQDLGIQVPIVGTNWNVGPADLAGQSILDFIDNHAYWDHPQFPSEPWSSTDWLINNTPMVRNTDGGTIASLMPGVGFTGKPFTISEYNHAFPNRYQSEGVLFLSAYGAFHNTDGLMFFDYGGSEFDWESDMVNGYFGIHRNTAMMSLMPSCAYAYRQGAIAPANETIALEFTADDILLMPKYDSGWWSGPQLYPQKLALQHMVRTHSFTSDVPFNPDNLPAEPVNPYHTDTEQIIWNTRGIMQVVTEKFIGLTGFLDDFPGHQAGPLTVKDASDFSTMTWVSLTDERLVDTRKSLLTVSSMLQNTGMIWNGTSTVHNNWGSAPTLMKPVSLTLSAMILADSIHIYPLDGTGQEDDYRTLMPEAKSRFEIILDQSQDKTVWWGIKAFGEGIDAVEEPLQSDLPDSYKLFQNYPNPFNMATTIPFQIPSAGFVRIDIYNITGQKVKTVVHEDKPAGSYMVDWSGQNDEGRIVSSGIYIIRLKAGAYIEQKKILLLK
jgi:hypothetical protein